MDLSTANRCPSPGKEYRVFNHQEPPGFEGITVRNQSHDRDECEGTGGDINGPPLSGRGEDNHKELQEEEKEEEDEAQVQGEDAQVNEAPCEISGEHLLFTYQRYDASVLLQLFKPSFFKLPCNFSYYSWENIVPFIPVPLSINFNVNINVQSPENLSTFLTPANTDVSYKYFSPTRVRSIMALANFCPHTVLDVKKDFFINGHLFYSSSAKAAILPPKLAISVLTHDAIMICLSFERGYISHEMLQYCMSIIGLIETHQSISNHTRKSIYEAIAHRRPKSITNLASDCTFMGFRSLITPRQEWSIILKGNLIFYPEKLCNVKGCKGEFYANPGKMIRPGRQGPHWVLAPQCCKYREQADIAHRIGGTLAGM